MSIFKRTGSNNFICEFELQGVKVRQSTRTANKAEAMAFEVQRRREILEDIERNRVGLKRLTLGALADRWLKVSETSHRDHKNNVSRVRKLFGEELRLINGAWVLTRNARYGLGRDLQVQDLTQDHLSRLKVARLSEKLSPATINREISLIQSLVGFAASISAVTPTRPLVWSHGRNKAASLKMAEGSGKLRWLSVEEETALLRSLSDTANASPNDQSLVDAHDLVLLLLDTGARYKEVAAIRWDQIDLQAGTINLYRSKTQNESVLYMPARTREVLQGRRDHMDALGRKFSYVFPKLKGRAWAPKVDQPRGHATRAIQRHIEAVGLNADYRARGRVTPHTFRDTFASRLVQAGVSLFKVSKLLGHSSTQMTEKYAHLSPDAPGVEAAAILDRLHGGNKHTYVDGPIPVPTSTPDSGKPSAITPALAALPSPPRTPSGTQDRSFHDGRQPSRDGSPT